ncbi:unnamed protein product [Ixodes persulcatus]
MVRRQLAYYENRASKVAYDSSIIAPQKSSLLAHCICSMKSWLSLQNVVASLQPGTCTTLVHAFPTSEQGKVVGNPSQLDLSMAQNGNRT